MTFDLRTFTDRLCRFPTTAGHEAPAAEWVRDQLADLGFETYTWDADATLLADHPSFPDDLDADDVAGRTSVAGAFAFGEATLDGDGADGDAADADAADAADPYPTLVLNGHLDVVPTEPDEWDTDAFEPEWRDRDGEPTADRDEGVTLTARGAADMKAGFAACVGAALDLRDAVEADDVDLDARVVVEGVAGEEDGGYGAATAAAANPYPFERDAALVAEPTELRPVVACEGSLMAELELTGRSAHAATRWVGEDVLPRFERIRAAFRELETERGERVTHPLYAEFPVPWPVVAGRVEAGSWASTVPATLTAAFRIGVAPGETVAQVEAEFRERLAAVAADDPWLREHPPRFERFSVQFEPAEVDPATPVVEAVQAGMRATDLHATEPKGATYGADSRHYIEAGIPTVLFGPGTIEEAHFPNETVYWPEVEGSRRTIATAAAAFLGDDETVAADVAAAVADDAAPERRDD
ncbi:M20/M25/M40 family metallo-hydrolase [Haloparvum sp. PAK95]|uniref:M20/M25/M40 family metallo-hydrolase n=1 Tax=Haloparvum sp. PAK95 TaxID=3418962 RepID=UPI003D2F2EC2